VNQPLNANKFISFALTVLLKDWGIFGIANIVTIVAFLIAPLINSSWTIEKNMFILLFILIFVFISKTIKQFYFHFNLGIQEINVVSMISGEGAYEGSRIISLQYYGFLQKNTLLTLYSKSSGIRQPLCLLKVVSSDINAQETLCIQFVPLPDNTDLSHYFNEEVRKKSLFASPVIDFETINRFQYEEVS
jgi:hypothetical protein